MGALLILWIGLRTDEFLLTAVACACIGMAFCSCDVGLAQQANNVAKSPEAAVPQREIINEASYTIIGFLFGGFANNLWSEGMWIAMIAPMLLFSLLIFPIRKKV